MPTEKERLQLLQTMKDLEEKERETRNILAALEDNAASAAKAIAFAKTIISDIQTSLAQIRAILESKDREEK
jgi:hypothetical protein